MKTYSTKFNAQRAARAAGIEPGEIETVRLEAGFAWRRKAMPKPDAAPTSSARRAPRRRLIPWAEMEAVARRGKLPAPPDFSAPTHARYRNKLARLIALAKAGDIAGLEAMAISPVSTSPKAMKRYRDLCVIALKTKDG
jgi:hypothetical protein